MKPLLEWLLDLDGIRLGRDAPLLLKWRNPIEAWLIFSAALLACTWVVLIYRRELTSMGRRMVLASVRFGLIALAAAILCQPALVLQRNQVQHSFVAVAFDTSASMATKEEYRDDDLSAAVADGAGVDDPSGLGEQSRMELLRAALTRNGGGALRKLLQRNDAQLWPFAVTARMACEIPGQFRSNDGPDRLVMALASLRADGTRTDLAGALQQILDKSRERRLAAIVLATDGQSTQPTILQDALAEARRRRIPIYPLRIGSTYAPRDVAIESVRTRGSVFVNDMAAFEVEIRAQGLTEPTELEIRLIDIDNDEVAASRKITLGPRNGLSDGASTLVVELSSKVTRAGSTSYRVEVSPLSDETVLDNNIVGVDLTILDDQLRVLYVDGYPRYEYRYIKNALVREKTMDLSVLLIEADDAFVQEGTVPIRRFPQTMDELNLYDVILFGDVDPSGGWLNDAQMDMLVSFVGQRGGGFGVVAGERFVPNRFVGTPLEKLVPVRVAGHVRSTAILAGDGANTESFKPIVTAQGRRSPVLRLALDDRQVQEQIESLPGFYWFARSLGAKPGASVLLEHPSERTATGLMPLVVTARYGAGKLFFQATDDTWRWRREHGELLHDTYWVQVVRDLARGNRRAPDRRVEIRTDRRVYPYGSTIQAQVEFLDPELLARQGDELTISAMRALTGSKPVPHERVPSSATEAEPSSTFGASGTPGLGASGTHPTAVDTVAGRFVAHRISDESNIFEGTWIPPFPATFSLTLNDILVPVGRNAPTVVVRVERPNLEVRNPEANHDVLRRIASATGGRVIDLNELESQFDAIKDRSIRVPDDIVESIWDSKLALILFVLMISVEWVLRKVFGLL